MLFLVKKINRFHSSITRCIERQKDKCWQSTFMHRQARAKHIFQHTAAYLNFILYSFFLHFICVDFSHCNGWTLVNMHFIMLLIVIIFCCFPMQNNLSYYQCQRNITWNLPTVMTKIFDFLFFDILLGTQRHEDCVVKMLRMKHKNASTSSMFVVKSHFFNASLKDISEKSFHPWAIEFIV